MKEWQEAKEVFGRLREVLSRGGRAVLAVTTRVEGSAYRGPGALVLIGEDGTMAGNVTGGCLEQDLQEKALAQLQQGTCGFVSYDTGGTQDQLWGLGIGCEGIIHLFLRPFPRQGDRELVEHALDYLEQGREFALVLVLDEGPRQGDALLVEPAGSAAAGDTVGQEVSRKWSEIESGEMRVAGQRLMILKVPRPRDLVIFGAGDDSVPLARYAAEAGFRVFVVDHRPAYLTHERFPQAEKLVLARYNEELPLNIGPETCLVVKTRLLEHDRGWVQRLVQQRPRYLGLLGPARRREKVCEGLSSQTAGQIFAPIGLDIGAIGPEQIAISIIAEILAVLSGSPGGHARDKKGPLHRRTAS